ncbi:MAG TPA: hypothetical protein VGS20_04950 [Candidatus Acidoferrales bacterium]|nr:hypothetical protein [Candidatus Acidoferrales bacterium]
MSNKWFCRLAGVLVLLLGAMALPQKGFAQLEIYQQIGTNGTCGTPSASTGGVPTVNREGITEEGADVVVEAEGAGNFTVGHQISVTITNGVDLTSPVVATGGNLPLANVVLCDPALAITQPVVNRSLTILGVQVTISFQVTAANTSGEGEVVFRNLRWDVTDLTNGGIFKASAVDCTNPPSCTTSTAIPLAGDETVTGSGGFLTLGTALDTIASSFMDEGVGIQNANGGLLIQADLGFDEGFLGALRSAIPASPPSHPGDIATTPTSVEFAVVGDTDINGGAPIAGVSVAFPSQFLVDPLDGALLLGSPTGTCSGTGLNLDCTYQTLASDVDADDMAFTTANGTAIVTAAAAAANTIVVTIGSSSGSGVMDLVATFGPDANTSPAAIPRYMHSKGCSSVFDDCFAGSGIEGRGIIKDAFFEIVPTKTDIVVPWVTNLFGFNAGISVSNTGLDTFGTFFCPTPPCAATSQGTGISNTGPVTVTLFPDDGTAPIIFTTGPGKTPGRGLAANGTLAPGATWAVDLTGLLAAAGVVTPKEGYMLIQTGFTLGHAAVFVFTPSFGFADTPAIVLPTNVERGSIFAPGSPFVVPEPQGQVARRKH